MRPRPSRHSGRRWRETPASHACSALTSGQPSWLLGCALLLATVHVLSVHCGSTAAVRRRPKASTPRGGATRQRSGSPSWPGALAHHSRSSPRPRRAGSSRPGSRCSRSRTHRSARKPHARDSAGNWPAVMLFFARLIAFLAFLYVITTPRGLRRPNSEFRGASVALLPGGFTSVAPGIGRNPRALSQPSRGLKGLRKFLRCVLRLAHAVVVVLGTCAIERGPRVHSSELRLGCHLRSPAFPHAS